MSGVFALLTAAMMLGLGLVIILACYLVGLSVWAAGCLAAGGMFGGTWLSAKAYLRSHP